MCIVGDCSGLCSHEESLWHFDFLATFASVDVLFFKLSARLPVEEDSVLLGVEVFCVAHLLSNGSRCGKCLIYSETEFPAPGAGF